jgi:hypothetical protein
MLAPKRRAAPRFSGPFPASQGEGEGWYHPGFEGLVGEESMSAARALILVSSLAVPVSAQDAQPLKITHQPPQCLVPDRYAELRAKVDPIALVLRARILFRTDPLAEPHAILMRQEGQEFVGVLPRPLPTLSQVQYWVEAADPALLESVTDEFTVPVQASCPQAAKAKKSARAEVTAPLGAPLVPAGFASDEQVADATFKKGSGKAGVFNIGPTTSLIAALAVGAGAVAVAASKNPGGNPPERPVEVEPAGVRFIESTPAPGGTVRLSQGGLRLTVRYVVPTGNTAGAPTIEFRQNAGGPVCMTQAFQMPNEFLEPHEGRNVTFQQFRPTGACGDSFEVTVARAALSSVFGGPTFTTGTAEIPDLALRYLITP